jgi:hypothetical protein
MGRSYNDWIAQQDQALVAKVRKDDEANKPLLNQINWIWIANLMNKKADLNPTSAELLDWVTSGQIDAMRHDKK